MIVKPFSEYNNTKDILRQGFEHLIENTHLVGEQVSNNLDEFLTLDTDKFEKIFGKIIKFLGAGVFGAVFALDNSKVLKITFDFVEAPFLYDFCLLNKTEGFVEVDAVYKIKFGETFAYIIVREPLKMIDKDISEVISDYKQGKRKKYTGLKQEVANALNAMYEIDPTWRGTHSANIAYQDGKVVLYDGFSKNIRLDDKKIPFMNL